jgi:hypothetical protein
MRIHARAPRIENWPDEQLRIHNPIIAPSLHHSARVPVQRPVCQWVMVHGSNAQLINKSAEAAGDSADKVVAERSVMQEMRPIARETYVLASSHMLLNESRAYSVVFTFGSLPGNPGHRLIVTPIGAYTCVPLYRRSCVSTTISTCGQS